MTGKDCQECGHPLEYYHEHPLKPGVPMSGPWTHEVGGVVCLQRQLEALKKGYVEREATGEGPGYTQEEAKFWHRKAEPGRVCACREADASYFGPDVEATLKGGRRLPDGDTVAWDGIGWYTGRYDGGGLHWTQVFFCERCGGRLVPGRSDFVEEV